MGLAVTIDAFEAWFGWRLDTVCSLCTKNQTQGADVHRKVSVAEIPIDNCLVAHTWHEEVYATELPQRTSHADLAAGFLQNR